MSATEPEVSNASDDELRSHLLTDAELALFESRFTGFRLISNGRYHARLTLQGVVFFFTLIDWGGADRQLTVDVEQGALPDELWALAWHRGAEAMLAVRKGHVEYRRRRIAKTVRAQA